MPLGLHGFINIGDDVKIAFEWHTEQAAAGASPSRKAIRPKAGKIFLV